MRACAANLITATLMIAPSAAAAFSSNTGWPCGPIADLPDGERYGAPGQG